MIATAQDKYDTLLPMMNEKMRRRWAGCEAMALGRGGISAVARETGMSRTTILRGIREVQEDMPQLAESVERQDQQRVRRPGAGRPRRIDEDVTLLKDLPRIERRPSGKMPMAVRIAPSTTAAPWRTFS